MREAERSQALSGDGAETERLGGLIPDAGACALLLRELETLGERLAGADVVVQGALRPRMLARAIRLAYDPFSRTRLARLAAADRDGAGVRPAAAWSPS